jgi:cytochrome c2
MRLSLVCVALSFAACGRPTGEAAPPTAGAGAPRPSTAVVDLSGPTTMPRALLAAGLTVDRAGCARCHELPAAPAWPLVPSRGPALAQAAGWWRDGLAGFLEQHHGGTAAADLAAWVVAQAPAAAEATATSASAAAEARGSALFRELACAACHTDDSLERLATRTDHRHVAAFLREPNGHRPGLAHDFQLAADEANALASWLLRDQRSTGTAPVPGFAYEYFERTIADAGLPKLDGEEPTARGLTVDLDVGVATRKNHFALRFRATIDVPQSGEWTFTVGSDDSSWLWIDDRLLVRNEALAPYRRKSGTVQLEAGPHELVVVYTEAAGEERLDVLWQGPGVAEQPLPASVATVQSAALVAPPWPAAPSAEAVARGRVAARERRCDACHDVADAEFAALPAPPPARPFVELGGGVCPHTPNAGPLATQRRELTKWQPTPTDELHVAMAADGCLACHQRAGEGGLSPAARQGLAEREDLGDEGRLPPALDRVGQRLRRSWIERLLAGSVRARPYLSVRMPKLSAERAAWYAERLQAADHGQEGSEPPFTAAAALHGAQLAGLGGRNCVTCHTFAGRRALGPQGMDLAIQYERLTPEWFTDWLLAPQRHRPGTRMLAAWTDDGPEARAEIAALRAWSSLGAGAPLPTGLDRAEGLRLTPGPRPILHGAFLRGLSARCIAVGTPLRAHYAFDVEHGRLAWLWRGDFVDASGTWVGRAGQLLEPLGDDRRTLVDFVVAGTRRTVGRREDPFGHPIFAVAVGGARYEDVTVPELRAGGAVFVRTLRCVEGEVEFDFAPQRQGDVTVVGPPDRVKLAAGQQVEVVYSW